MAAYESDSSVDDETEYTTTNVILGYASTESSGDDISHIGGHPTWLDPSITPPAALARCKVCHGYLSLLLQLNADLQQHFPHDTRRMYIWHCKNTKCFRKPGSIRAIREVKKSQSSRRARSPHTATKPQSQTVDLGSALFGGSSNGDGTNPFSTGSSAQGVVANPFSGLPSLSTLAAKPSQGPTPDVQPPTQTFAEKLNLNSSAPEKKESTPQEVWPEKSAFPEPYPFFYLDAYPEELEPISTADTDVIPGASRTQYDADDSGSAATEKDTSDMNIDKTFQKFSDVVAQNPEQVLRYEFKGQPLLYSGTDGVASRFVVPHAKSGAIRGMPRCETCGAQRVFELQVTPYLIFEIEKDESMDVADGMEWGTIVVGSCINDCGDSGTVAFREEWVGVQWEERVAQK